MTDRDFDPPLTDHELGYLVDDDEEVQWCDDCGIEIHHRGRCRYCAEAARADDEYDQAKDDR
jgi:hypothetical protein